VTARRDLIAEVLVGRRPRLHLTDDGFRALVEDIDAALGPEVAKMRPLVDAAIGVRLCNCEACRAHLVVAVDRYLEQT
jgi:hypothetical protein